jgi:molecular chaperone HtpG
MQNLHKLVTSKALDTLAQLAKDDPEKYARFWDEFGRSIKQGAAMEKEPESIHPLLRFRTSQYPEKWSSLDEIIERMKPEQNDFYYILGDDERSVLHSPHLDILRRRDYEALLLTDPLDSFVFVRFTEYQDHKFINVASANFKLPPEGEKEPAEAPEPEIPEGMQQLVEHFKQHLGERVSDVRLTDQLSESPARLVDAQGEMNPELQRVYRYLNKSYEPPKKVLELNQNHPILLRLVDNLSSAELVDLVVSQIYENALLIEGLHPDPASMIARIQQLMQKALE